MGQLRRSDILGKRGHWLLDFELNGRPFRFATAPLLIARDDGSELFYQEGLQDFSHSLTGEGSTDFTIPIELDASENWEVLVANFVTLERAPAIVRRYFEGQILEEARVVVRGQLQGFAYGERLERVTFNVVRRIRTRGRMFPTPGMVVDEDTWPVRALWNVPETILGAFYPIIVGAPGTTAGVTGGNPATDGLMVEQRAATLGDRLMIAGHRVQATSVTVHDYTDETAPISNVIAVQETTDLVGRIISYCDLTVFGAAIQPGDVFYVSWDANGNGGGLKSTTTNGLLRGGHEIIVWLYETWTDTDIDDPSFSAHADFLNAYKFDTFINEPIDPEEWIQSEIIPFLPIAPLEGAEGLYFYRRRFNASRTEAVARLDADTQRISRGSAITTQSTQIVNEVTVEFQPDRSTGRFRSRVTISADDLTRGEDELEAGLLENDVRIQASYRARLSRQRFDRQSISIQLNAVWDEPTAVRIATDIISEQALPRRFVDYVGETDLEAFGIGDIVILNDTSVELIDVVALILDMTVGGPDVVLHFELIDDPIQLERLAS